MYGLDCNPLLSVTRIVSKSSPIKRIKLSPSPDGTNSVSVNQNILERKSSSYFVRYFVKNHQCFLGTDDFQRKGLYRIFYFALNKTTVNLSGCETGKNYGVFAENGKLIVRSE